MVLAPTLFGQQGWSAMGLVLLSPMMHHTKVIEHFFRALMVVLGYIVDFVDEQWLDCSQKRCRLNSTPAR